MVEYLLSIVGEDGAQSWKDRPVPADGDFAAKADVTAYLRGWTDRLPSSSGYTFELAAIGSQGRQRVGDGRVTLNDRGQPVIEWQDFRYQRFREEPKDYSVTDPHDAEPVGFKFPKPPKPPELTDPDEA